MYKLKIIINPSSPPWVLETINLIFKKQVPPRLPTLPVYTQ